VKEKGSIDDKKYSKFTERVKSTRSLDFKHLVEQGVFEREEKGKNTFYRLKKNLTRK
jgi:hypothetical protein